MNWQLFASNTLICLLLLAACQAGSNSRGGEQPPGRAANRPANSLKCPAQESMCPMIFDPAVCELKMANGETMRASGSNSCLARVELHRRFCERKSHESREAAGEIECKKDSGHSSQKVAPGG